MNRILIALLIAVFTGLGCDREPPATNSPPPRTTPPVQEAQPPEVDEEELPPAKEDENLPPAVEQPPPVEARPSMPPKFAPPADPKVATFAGLTAPKPVTWIWSAPQRQFSVAEYAVPGRDGHDQARVDVFIAGGSVEANIDRWKTQFRNSDGTPVEPKITPLESDGMPITLVEFAGEYRGMGMVSFTPGQLFLCAIVQTPTQQIFIRLVGPAGTVEPNREAYMDMIRNLKRVEPEK